MRLIIHNFEVRLVIAMHLLKALISSSFWFKAKVGADVENDKRRLAIIRNEIGEQSTLACMSLQ